MSNPPTGWLHVDPNTQFLEVDVLRILKKHGLSFGLFPPIPEPKPWNLYVPITGGATKHLDNAIFVQMFADNVNQVVEKEAGFLVYKVMVARSNLNEKLKDPKALLSQKDVEEEMERKWSHLKMDFEHNSIDKAIAELKRID
jgi:hypothetical protein